MTLITETEQRVCLCPH